MIAAATSAIHTSSTHYDEFKQAVPITVKREFETEVIKTSLMPQTL